MCILNTACGSGFFHLKPNVVKLGKILEEGDRNDEWHITPVRG